MVSHDFNRKGTISTLYSLLQAHSVLSNAKFRRAGFRLTEDMWKAILHKIHNSSINARHRLIQFKAVHRLYYTKSRLNAIYPDISPLCDKCKQDTGTLTHQLWLCPSLHSFWPLIFDYISKSYNITIVPDPLLAIFGLSVNPAIDNHTAQAISFCTF